MKQPIATLQAEVKRLEAKLNYIKYWKNFYAANRREYHPAENEEQLTSSLEAHKQAIQQLQSGHV